MTNEQLIKTIDNIGTVILDIDIKVKDAVKMAEIIKAIAAVRNELANRKDDEDVISQSSAFS